MSGSVRFTGQDGPVFKTTEVIQQNLRSQVSAAYSVKDHVTFVGDETRDRILGRISLPEERAETFNDDLNSDPPLDSPDLESNHIDSNGEAGHGGDGGENTPRNRTDAAKRQAGNREGRLGKTLVQGGQFITNQAITAVEVIAPSDYDGASIKSAGLNPAIAGAAIQATTITAAGRSAVNVGKAAIPLAADIKDGTIKAKDAISYGISVVGREGKAGLGSITRSALRNTLGQAQRFRAATDDFSGNAVGDIKDGAFAAGHGIKRVFGALRFIISHPFGSLISVGVAVLIILLIVIICVVNSMASTTVTTTICTDPANVKALVDYLNQYRNESITEEIYNAFAAETDPNGNPYGYDTLTGRYSNNLQHGVTWSYANGISNDTAEIISLATVYFQQNWPPNSAFSSFDGYPIFDYCRDLTAYGLDVVAKESPPYSCLVYGGCVNGYRSEGETVTITDYKSETHTCGVGNSSCGHWTGSESTGTRQWNWDEGHSDGGSYEYWVEDGSHDVTVYFPIIFPDGANESELEELPEDAVVVEDTISAGDCEGNLVLENANLYKGLNNDWFYTPDDEFSAEFSVVTGDGDNAITDTYEVTFTNATAIPWCPGELCDGQFGHYDLNCTIYLAGYDEYADPETENPDGTSGGSGNLQALAAKINDGTVTRTVVKQNQYGVDYIGNSTATRYTKTVELPEGASGFLGWYDAAGEDAYENVAWAELIYKMDWEDLYGITDGIKCRTVGSRLSAEELAELLEQLGLSGDDARAQVVGFALACQGQFSYGQPSSLGGGPGAPVVGSNLDCSSFIQYCFWAVGLPYSASWTGAYATASDLVPIDPGSVQPGDVRVVYAAGNAQGHVQMYVGGGSWIECAAGFGVGLNLSNGWMESRPCHYFTYAGF